MLKLRRDGLLVSVFGSYVLGHGYAFWPGHTKDHYRNDTNCLPAWHVGIMVGV